MENLQNGYFYYSYFIPNFWNRYFSVLLTGDRKINKIYQRRTCFTDKYL